jgi:RNA polymerase sigma-70 factor (ECF subfamily)
MDPDERKARLEELFAEHSASVLGYARRRADPNVADDVLSEVFAIAWRRLDQIPADAKPWLLACARRVLANSRRGERRRVALMDRLIAITPRIEIQAAHSGVAVVEALATLSERDREALLLVAWEGLSAEQAAAVVGCSRHAFSMRLSRARKRLLNAMPAAEQPNFRPFTEACND